jgi:uncharacterized protein (DUF486 family)
MRSVTRTEQLIRSVLLLICSAIFSGIAWLAGVYNLSDQRWTYGAIVLIVGAAAVISRLSTKWIVRNYVQPKA